MRNIGESKIYLIPQLVADNEYWINPRLGNYDLLTHYDNIKQMVKAKTGRAMQEKERERKTKSGKIVKIRRVFKLVVVGLSPTTTHISYSIGWTTILVRAVNLTMMI